MSGLLSDITSTIGAAGQDASSVFGAFSGAGGLLSDAAAAAQALAGGGAVTLGPFTFQDTEVPAQIPYGGQQRLAVQKMIGGARQINTLGPDKADIKWTGMIRSADRAERAATLAQMMASGKSFPLTWGAEYLEVVIRSFQPVTTAFWINYTIICCVVSDYGNGTTTPQPDALTSVADDALAAVGLSPADLPAVSSAVGQLQSAIAAASALVPGSSVFGNILNATGAAQAALTGAQSAANGNLLGVVNAAATGAGLLGASNATEAINQMGGIVQAAGDLGAATQTLGYVNRISQNLGAQF